MLPFCWPPQAKAHYWMIISLLQGLGSWSEKKEGNKKRTALAPLIFPLTHALYFACPQLSTKSLEPASCYSMQRINQSDSSICSSKSRVVHLTVPCLVIKALIRSKVIGDFVTMQIFHFLYIILLNLSFTFIQRVSVVTNFWNAEIEGCPEPEMYSNQN